MALVKIPMNRIEKLIKTMESSIEPVALARGWNQYHRSQVSELTLDGGLLLVGEVRETAATWQVTLHLDQVNDSQCTCPAGKGWCKHKAAVLFKAYSVHSRPELLFVSMQKAAGVKQRALDKANRQARPTAAVPQSKELPADWHQLFERRFSGYILSYQQTVDSFLRAAVDSLMPFAKDWEAPLAGLYQMHILLFVLRRIERFRKDNQSSYVTYFSEPAARNTAIQCRERLRSIAVATDASALRERWPRHYKQTKDMVRELLLTPAAEANDPLNTYRLFWEVFFARTETSQAEEKWLRSLPSLDYSERQQDFILLALAHFAFLAGDDERAIAQLDGLHTRQPADFEEMLARLSRLGEWTRMMIWMRWLLPVLPRAQPEEFHRLCVYWTEATRETGAHEEWITSIRALLPRSYPYYTDYLMKNARYREWVDLQLARRVPVVSLTAPEFKTIRDADPALILPIYHQSIERLIALKNRNSYGEAVRYLKKLRACYSDLGQTVRWTVYMSRLADKYARLRALQEEFEKGKLLS